MNKINYTARCHCGQISFIFFSEEIKTGKRCNCSICIRKGNVMTSTYIPTSDIELPKDMSKLVDYRWNDFVCGHYFCKTCGVHTFIGDPKYGYRINLGCVEGLDALTLNIDIIDGRSMPISGNPGPHPGE